MATKTEKAQIDLIINGEVANKSMRDLEAAARKAKSELRGLAPDSARFKELSSSVEKINKELEQTRVKAGLAKSSWDKMKDSIKTTFIGNLGANLATVGVQKLAQSIMDGVQTFKEFQSSLKNLSAITGLSGKDLEYLGDQAQKTSVQTGIAAKDVVEAYKLIASAKPELLENKEALSAITREAIALSHASGLDLPEASKRLTDALNQYSASAEEAGHFTNVLAEGARLSAAEVPDITDALLQFGVAAKSANISIEESVAVIEAMAEKGVKGAEAGTKLRNVLTALNAPEVLDKKALGYFEKYGVNLQVLSDKTLPFSDRLKELAKIQGDAGAYTSIFGKENSIAAQIVVESTARVQELTTALGKDGLTTAYDQAAINTATLATASNKLGAAWDNIMTKQGGVGKFLTGFITDLTKAIVTLDNMGSTWNLWMNALTGAKLKDKTIDYILDFGTLDEGRKKVSDYFREFDKMTNKDFLAKNAEGKKEFIADLAKEGVALDTAAKLFEQYSKRRTDAMISSYKQGKNPAVDPAALAKQLAEQQAAADKFNELDKKAGAKRIAEAKKTADALLKIEMDRAEANFKEIESDNERMRQYGIKVGKEVMASIEEGRNAAAELKRLTATTSAEEVAATREAYALKMEKYQEGSSQYKLLHAQMLKEIADTEKTYADASVKTEEEKNNAKLKSIQSAADALTSVLSTLGNWQNQQMNIEMARTRKFYTDKKTSLKDQLDHGLITQQQYDSEIIRLNEESERKEREMQQRQAQSQKDFAVFESAIKAALAWVEAYIFPWKIPQAIAATAQAGLIAAMPIPEFYSGGWMPNSTNDKQAFPIIAHANEYMVDAASARDPFVMDTIGIIESAKQLGVSPSQISEGVGSPSNSSVVNNTYASNLSDEKLDRLISLLESGLVHKFEIDDEAGFKLNRLLKKQQILDSTDLL
jgi:TP901 family phage tail tape measure protein